eukprot:scaffold4061_cov108-Cylindrotheca_fusiformis.AAC.5
MPSDPAVCQVCNFRGSDISFQGCRCQIHAVSLFQGRNCPSMPVLFPCATALQGRERGSEPCSSPSLSPLANVDPAPNNGICLHPLPLSDLEEAVRVRTSDAEKQSNNGKKRRYDDEDLEVEAQYVVYSQGRNTISASLADTDNSRTGRWTAAEVAYADHLTQAFDEGQLPLPNGTRLSTFLGDLLLCKASRLTKKMKNAKLSARIFERNTGISGGKDKAIELSALQERFIDSMQTKVAKMELRFNLVRQWRTFFSDLCVQMQYKNLDARDWIASLDEMESRASKVEESMRALRRKRMGISGNSGTMTTSRPEAVHPFSDSSISLHRTPSDDLDSALAVLDDSNMPSLQDMLEEEKTSLSRFFDREIRKSPPGKRRRAADSFISALAQYMEESSLPFQHADVWAPSFSNGNPNEVQLLHAGNATRRDQGGAVLSKFTDFGELSKSFTFQPNQGLPGRVYTSGKAEWGVQLTNPAVFRRHRYAQTHGLRTAIAIPITSRGGGRLVVVFYSIATLMEDTSLISRCASDLSSYAPVPRWKLVIEVGNEQHKSVGPESNMALEQGSEVASSDLGPVSDDKVMCQMISLLGNEIPLGECAPSTQELLPVFMSIRLLLLRPVSCRTAEENDIVDVLRRSYLFYSNDKQRSSSDLARQLATEYRFLKQTCDDFSQTMPLPFRQHSPKDEDMMDLQPLNNNNQLEAPAGFMPPFRGTSHLLGPPGRLPHVVSQCSSTNDMSAVAQSFSEAAIARSTYYNLTSPDFSSEGSPSF